MTTACTSTSGPQFGNVASAASFLEVSNALGMNMAQGTEKKEPYCLFNPSSITAKFPSVVPPGYSSELQRQCDPEHSAGGAGAVDVNGDSRDDLIFTRTGGHPLLYLNESSAGNPKFTEASKDSGFEVLKEATNGVAAADIDNDGDQDIFLSVMAGSHAYLLINDGSGHFSEESISRGVGMLDGLPQSGTSATFGDFNNDGWLDLHTGEWQSSEIFQYGVASHSRLFKNLGAEGKPGVFQDVTEIAGVAIESRVDNVYSFASSFTDFDGDGFPDLAIAGDFNTSRLFWNNTDGTFTEGSTLAGVANEENGMGLAVGFFGDTPKPAMMVTSIMATPQCDDVSQLQRSGNRLYVYNSERKFDNATDKMGVRDGGWGWGVAFIDARNTGRNDIVSAVGMKIDAEGQRDCYRDGAVRFWTNDGTDSFTESAGISGLVAGAPSKAVVVTDLDQDGRLDVVMTRDENTPRIFMNTTKNVGHWIGIDVRGIVSNADARGAIVTVRTGNGAKTMRSFVGGGSRFLSTDSRIVHFGLGSSSSVDTISVFFPTSGKTITMSKITADQIIKIVEPN